MILGVPLRYNGDAFVLRSLLSREQCYLPDEWALVTLEARNHRCQKFVGIELVQVKGVSRAISKQGEERRLCSAVAFSKGVNGVERRKK